MSLLLEYSPGESPKKALREFLQMRVIDLPGVNAHDLQKILQENRDAGMHTEPHPDHARDSHGRFHTLQEIHINPETMTIREFMSFSLHHDFYDPFIQETSRNTARKTMGSDYDLLIDECDDTASTNDKVRHPLRKYLAMFDALTLFADSDKPLRAPIKPQTLCDGIAVMGELAERQHRWSDMHLENARSADILESHYYHRLGYDILHHVQEHGTLPDQGLSRIFKARLELSGIAPQVKWALTNLNHQTRHNAMADMAEIIKQIARDTQPVNYEQMALEEVKYAQPIDAAARLNERLIEGLQAIAPKLGVSIGSRHLS
jgi:hypothetical protein